MPGRRSEDRNTAMSQSSAARKSDPVVTEIVRNGVLAVTEEMKTNLTRTG